MVDKVCDVDPEAKKELQKFRMAGVKYIAAIILKIDKKDMLIKVDTKYEDCTIEEIQEELPENQPRYIVLSYKFKHSDGRQSYPLCFIFSSPLGSSPEQKMMYASSKTNLCRETDLNKSFDIRDIEEFTEEWLIDKLNLK